MSPCPSVTSCQLPRLEVSRKSHCRSVHLSLPRLRSVFPSFHEILRKRDVSRIASPTRRHRGRWVMVIRCQRFSFRNKNAKLLDARMRPECCLFFPNTAYSSTCTYLILVAADERLYSYRFSRKLCLTLRPYKYCTEKSSQN